jgi:hypothetical protein
MSSEVAAGLADSSGSRSPLSNPPSPSSSSTAHVNEEENEMNECEDEDDDAEDLSSSSLNTSKGSKSSEAATTEQLVQQIENQKLANFILKTKLASIQQEKQQQQQQQLTSTVNVILDFNSVSKSEPVSLAVTPTHFSRCMSLQSTASTTSEHRRRGLQTQTSVPEERTLRANEAGGEAERIGSASFLVKRMFLENQIGLLIGSNKSTVSSKHKSKKKSSSHHHHHHHRHRNLKLQLGDGLDSAKGEFNKLNANSVSSTTSSSGGGSTSSSRSNSEKEKLDKSSSSVTSSSSSAAATTNKTPKSALLEKRRKAVFELLTHEIYPSGKQKALISYETKISQPIYEM